MILPADKGKCLVVMDKEEYIEKMEEKLRDETTYQRIEKDPTNDIKETLSKLLNKIKDEKQIDTKTFYRLQPTKAKIPRMYGLPKIHKENYPLREIVDSTGSVVKETDRYISKIIQKYTGKTQHFVKNSAHFVEMIKDLTVDEDEILVSYDVTALFPSVPQEEAIQIFYIIMKNDKDLDKKTSMTAENVIKLFRTCVQTTYFVFNQNLYKQINGLAIGASSSGPAADLFMEHLEKKALSTFIAPPKIWKRYVDDTFSKLKMMQIDAFLEHLNSQHPRIKFTTEIQQSGKIAFLDTQVHVLEDGSTKVTIYRKATHTDQYLDFTSNHHIKQKTGIYQTFEHRVEEIVTNEEDQKKERKHVRKSLRRCGYPTWTLTKRKKNKEREEQEERRGKVILPYIKGTSERMARIFKRYNIETIHKPTTKLRSILCNKMKDRIETLDKTGAVYYNTCRKHPESTYVGETERVLRERMYEHRMIDHKTARRYASLSYNNEENKAEEENEGQQTRRSARIKKKVDYKAIHSGSNQQLTIGNTEFSAHVASDQHNKDDLQYKVIGSDAA